MLERLLILMRGDKRDYAPTAPIRLNYKLRVMLVRFMRLLNGDKSVYAPISPISFDPN